MDLNIFKNIREDIKNNIDVKGFIEELTNFLKKHGQTKNKRKSSTNECK